MDLMGKFDVQELKTSAFYKDLSSEFIATFLLMFIGIGASIYYHGYSTFGMQVGLSMGLTIEALYIVFNQTSGALCSPTTTLSFFIAGYMTAPRCFLYCIMHILGGLFAAGVFTSLTSCSLPVPKIDDEINMIQAFCVEFFSNMILSLSSLRYFNPSTGKMELGGSAIVGFIYTATIGMTDTFSRGFLNPVKAFGPSVVMNDYHSHWLYWSAPLSAAFVCGLIHRLLYLKR